MARLLKYDGTTEEVNPADPSTGFSLGELYTLIGCELVQAISLEDGYVMFVDENGKLQDGWESRRNNVATNVLRLTGRIPGDFITGNALICNLEEFRS
jgi:hypothetical protein